MGYELNKKIRDLKPYDPISGEYKIRLDANESYLSLPDELREKLAAKIHDTAFNRYPDPLAADPCRAFADYYGVPENLVTAGNGSDELISVILTAFLEKGDEIITLDPEFSMYRFYASLTEAKSTVIKKREDLTIDVDELIERAQTARMILFSNPCNPTSLGLRREEVRRLVRSVPALVVLDEAYMDFWDQSLLSEVAEYDNLMILRTCSKAIGMAAVRLGFAVANETLTNALKAVKSPYNINTLTQGIGAAVLEQKELLSECREKLVKSRQELLEALKLIEAENPGVMKVYESCTNFVFIRMESARKVFDGLLAAGIAVRFMGDYLRITAGSQEENAELLRELRKLL